MKRIVLILVAMFFLMSCAPLKYFSSKMGFHVSPTLTNQPTPDSTTTVTPFPSATADPADDVLIYSDDFSDPVTGWDLFSDETNKSYYSNGEYFLEMNKSDSYQTVVSNDDLIDGVFSVDMRHVAGDPLLTSGMVFWRYQDARNYYAMQVTGDGNYSIHRFVNDNFNYFTLPTFSPFLKTDGTINKITVVFHKNTHDIYFNDQFVYRFNDDSINHGSFGLGAFPAPSSSVKIGFDNLKIYKYDPANPFTPSEPQLTPTPEYQSISWQQLTQFLSDDHTNWHEYDLEDYNCMDFAIDLVANARYANINAKIVTVMFVGQQTGHAFVAFETSDRGTIFVEPQGDNTYSHVEIGNDLCDDWGEFECMGTIESIEYFGECDHAQNCTILGQ